MRGDNSTRKGRRKQLRERGKMSARRSKERDSPGAPSHDRPPPAFMQQHQPQWAKVALSKARQNWTVRKTAKYLDVPIEDVREVFQRGGFA